MMLQFSNTPGPAFPNCCCLECGFLLERVSSAGNGTCDVPGTVLLPDTAWEGQQPCDEQSLCSPPGAAAPHLSMKHPKTKTIRCFRTSQEAFARCDSL